MDDIETWAKEELGEKLGRFMILYRRLENLVKDMPDEFSRGSAPVIQEVKNDIQDLCEETGVDVAVKIFPKEGRIEIIPL